MLPVVDEVTVQGSAIGTVRLDCAEVEVLSYVPSR
jgi:hypothetical protein